MWNFDIILILYLKKALANANPAVILIGCCLTLGRTNDAAGIEIFMNESRAPRCWLRPGGGGGSGWGGEGDISFRLHHWNDCCLLPTSRNIIKCQSCCKIFYESQGDTVILQWLSTNSTPTPDSQSDGSRSITLIRWWFPVKKKKEKRFENCAKKVRFSLELRSFPTFWLLARWKLEIKSSSQCLCAHTKANLRALILTQSQGQRSPLYEPRPKVDWQASIWLA